MVDSNSWLNDALRNFKPIERNPQGIASGQIRTVGFSNSDFSRMCVVLEVHSANNYCEVMLIHHEEEMATDVDLVISSHESDHFHTMVIQTDCHSVVFLLQLGEHVDNLTPEEMESIWCAKSGRDLVDKNLYTGMSMAGRLDFRWQFKVHEGDSIRALSNDCVSALLKGRVQTFLDPGIFSLELLTQLEDPTAVLVDVIDSLSGKVVSDPFVLNELGALNKEQWVKFDSAVGDQIHAMLQMKLLEQSLVPLEEAVTIPWGLNRKEEAGPLRVPPGAKVITATFTKNIAKGEAIAESEIYNYDLVDARSVG